MWNSRGGSVTTPKLMYESSKKLLSSSEDAKKLKKQKANNKTRGTKKIHLDRPAHQKRKKKRSKRANKQ